MAAALEVSSQVFVESFEGQFHSILNMYVCNLLNSRLGTMHIYNLNTASKPVCHMLLLF